MNVLRLDGTELAYSLRGRGPDVTLLHGFTQRGDAWDEIAIPLARSHRCITPDLRGHGATMITPATPISLRACADDVVALWDSLSVVRSHLVGYSMGGRLALQIAVAHPDRVSSLVLLSSHAGLYDHERSVRREQDDALAARIALEGIEHFTAYWESLPLFETLARRRPDLTAELHARRLANDPAALAASLRGMGAGVMRPKWDELGALDVPALVIAGADDSRYLAFARRLGAALPDARVEIVRDAGHAVHLEQPQIVGALLADFFREVDAP